MSCSGQLNIYCVDFSIENEKGYFEKKRIWSLKVKRPEAFIDKTLQSPAFPFSSQTIIFERRF